MTARKTVTGKAPTPPTRGQIKWAEYVRINSGRATSAEIARRTGIDQATVWRWLSDDPRKPTVPSAIAFARAYDCAPVEALIAAGLLTEADVSMNRRALATFSTAALQREMRARQRALADKSKTA